MTVGLTGGRSLNLTGCTLEPDQWELSDGRIIPVLRMFDAKHRSIGAIPLKRVAFIGARA